MPRAESRPLYSWTHHRPAGRGSPASGFSRNPPTGSAEGRSRRPATGAAATGAVALAAAQLGVAEGNAILVRPLAVAGEAAGYPEGFPGFVVPHQATVFGGPPSDDGGLPAMGELGPLPAHHREQEVGAGGAAQPLQVGDGGDAGRPGQGGRLLRLPLPLPGQVRRAENQYPPEADSVGRRRADEGLASDHLADDGGAPDGVGLRSQEVAEQVGQPLSVFRGPVPGRAGLPTLPAIASLKVSMNPVGFMTSLLYSYSVANAMGPRRPSREPAEPVSAGDWWFGPGLDVGNRPVVPVQGDHGGLETPPVHLHLLRLLGLHLLLAGASPSSGSTAATIPGGSVAPADLSPGICGAGRAIGTGPAIY